MGWAVNHKRVARIRREDNLLCVPKRAFRPADDGLAAQLACVAQPGAACGADGGQSALGGRHHLYKDGEEFVYLAVVLDAFSRRVVGWAMAEHLRAELALAALDMALGNS